MEVKTITYKRINNLGNYNSEHLEMTAELKLTDDPLFVTQELKVLVEAALGLNKPPVEKPIVYDNDAF